MFIENIKKKRFIKHFENYVQGARGSKLLVIQNFKILGTTLFGSLSFLDFCHEGGAAVSPAINVSTGLKRKER